MHHNTNGRVVVKSVATQLLEAADPLQLGMILGSAHRLYTHASPRTKRRWLKITEQKMKQFETDAKQ